MVLLVFSHLLAVCAVEMVESTALLERIRPPLTVHDRAVQDPHLGMADRPFAEPRMAFFGRKVGWDLAERQPGAVSQRHQLDVAVRLHAQITRALPEGALQLHIGAEHVPLRLELCGELPDQAFSLISIEHASLTPSAAKKHEPPGRLPGVRPSPSPSRSRRRVTEREAHAEHGWLELGDRIVAKRKPGYNRENPVDVDGRL